MYRVPHTLFLRGEGGREVRRQGDTYIEIERVVREGDTNRDRERVGRAGDTNRDRERGEDNKT